LRATVQMLNPRTGTFAVSTPTGLTVIELQDTVELEIDDEIIGDFDEHGSVRLRHAGSGEAFDAFIQAIGANERSARKLLG
jgi:hypothetical protein